MAVVSTVNIGTWHKDITNTYKLKVLYNSDLKFHIEIPVEFFDIVKHLDNLTDFAIQGVKKSRMDREYTKFVVVADSEVDCISTTKKCLNHLVGQSINQRDVIIVFYNPKDTCQYNDHRYNREHPQIGMQFALTYAVETSLGDKKIYSTYSERPFLNGNITRDRHEMSLWNKATTIIPDTPENRVTLESLYNAFVILNEKMKSFTETSEKLLEFIQSNVKLLN